MKTDISEEQNSVITSQTSTSSKRNMGKLQKQLSIISEKSDQDYLLEEGQLELEEMAQRTLLDMEVTMQIPSVNTRTQIPHVILYSKC